jgi:hypothetical protein
MKEQNSKMKLFKDSCASSKAKSKGFWSFLKGKKCHDYPAHIVDPDNKNNILTEEIDIKISLHLVILRVSILSLAIFFVWMLWTKSLT